MNFVVSPKDVNLSTVEGGKVKAYARAKLPDSTYSFKVRLIEGKEGFFLGYPSHKSKKEGQDDKWFPDAGFETEEERNQLLNAVISAYNAKIASEKK